MNLAVLILVVVATGAPATAAPADPLDGFELQAGQTPCYGRCPVYSLHLDAAGRLRVGRTRADERDVRTLPRAELVRVAQAFHDAGFFDFADDYPAVGTNHSKTYLELHWAGRNKKVTHDQSNRQVPGKLRELEKLMWELARPADEEEDELDRPFPTIPPAPTTVGPPSSWRERIRRGQPITVVLDETAKKFDDRHFSGDSRTDPLGTLKGGESYLVRYDANAHRFVTTGLNQWYGPRYTGTSSNGQLDLDEISLWGLVLHFDPASGEVRDARWGLVGHLTIR